MELKDKLRRLYLVRGHTRNDFVEQQLHDGFPTNFDKPMLEDIRADAANCIAPAIVKFSDPGYKQLLINYHARFFPTSLSNHEMLTWHEDCIFRLTSKSSRYLTMQQFNSEIIALLDNDNCTKEKKLNYCPT